ncbi:hypothetical protein Bca4012_011791 [Brassica carinata]
MKEKEEGRSCDDSSPVSVLDYVRVTAEPENTSRRSHCNNEQTKRVTNPSS